MLRTIAVACLVLVVSSCARHAATATDEDVSIVVEVR